MSLRHFQDWKIIGLHNYVRVFQDAVSSRCCQNTHLDVRQRLLPRLDLGLLLAVMLNGPVWGKSIYRVLLILPWAVPAYITALTWRGMFDYEFGAVNLLAGKYLDLP